MSYCPICHAQNPNGVTTCQSCGNPLSQYPGVPGPMPAQNYPAQPAPFIANYDPRWDYTPISVMGYIGYNILFALPMVGLICMLIFAFSSKNRNLKNYALSYLVVMLVLTVVLFLFGGLLMAFITNEYGSMNQLLQGNY